MSTWIKMSERKPTAGDANAEGEVWFWVPRFALVGPQRDFFHCADDATHWQPCALVPEFTPAPPVIELSQGQKDYDAYQSFFIKNPSPNSTYHAFLAGAKYARKEATA